MLAWLLALAAAAALSLLAYGRREPRPFSELAGAALLRFGALALILAAILDAPAGRSRPASMLVALDASSSWFRGNDSLPWQSALQSAQAGGDSLLLFGDSVRQAGSTSVGSPGDRTSRIGGAVARAIAAGRPLLVVTDGELDDPESLDALPGGSRVEVIQREHGPDVALLAIDAPRAASAGDTIEVRATLIAGGAGAGPGTLSVTLAGREAGSIALTSLGPWEERTVALVLAAPSGEGGTVLQAVALSEGDVEPGNDTLTVTLEVTAAAGAVLVSSAPDFDSRYMLAVLRGTLSVPSRSYFRVAPGVWRQEGSLAAASEADIRRALRSAPLAVIHGDTGVFGPPIAATTGALVLVAPPAERGDWYPVGAPISPLAAALSGLPWDSLAPINVAPAMPPGDWEGIETRRARQLERRVAIIGRERPRRTVVVGASGLWRWQFRGGASADAYSALWGSIFDWAIAERRDERAATPADALVREGERVRWRRGGAGPGDSATSVLAEITARDGAGRVDSLRLVFPAGGLVAESGPMTAGVYDIRIDGRNAMLSVNSSRELLPRRAVAESGDVGGAPAPGEAPGVRRIPWLYVLATLLLCAEWLVRRRLGLR
jgi:hypothetical protein